jgi:hypothetical protein
MTHRRIPDENGFALLAAALIGGIMLVLAAALVDSVLVGRQAQQTFEQSAEAVGIAQAGIDKAITCMNKTNGTNCGGTFGSTYIGEANVTFGDGRFTTTIAGTGSTKTITSVGTLATTSVTVVADLTTLPDADAMAFSYALQAGAGGAHLENNSEITGTIYTDGDIDCQTTAAGITGDAYVTKVNGLIDSCDVDYHAHADRILDSEVGGDAYYLTDPSGIAGTDVDGTKYPGSTRPTSVPLPEVDLDFWRDSAEEGGVIVGNHAPADNTHLGPVKIIGNLTLNNNVDIILDGPVWVVGDITMSNNSTFSLNSTFGANGTVLLADDAANQATRGKFSAVSNAGLSGSGHVKSHIAVVSTNSSTSDTTPAMSVANNASGAVFYAMNGTLRLQNNAGAKSLAAYRLFIDQNAEVTYLESELSDMNFSNSPGGVWALAEGTWRIVK